MRPLLLLALPLVLLTPFADAFAAKGQGGTTAATATDAEPLVLQKSGVADVDAVFTKAEAPIGTLNNVRVQMTTLRDNLAAALSLPAGTPFADSIADLKVKAGDKINVAVSERGLPKLSTTDAVPANVQAAVDATNAGIGNLETAMIHLAEVPAQLEEATAAAMAVDVTKVKATEMPKVTKVTKHNLAVLAQAEEDAKAIKAELDAMKTNIHATFKAM
jgi:hypothetical protein